MTTGIRRILIVQTAFLGDVILVTPLIAAAHERFPQAEIDALVLPQTQIALQNNPHIRQVLLFDKRTDKLRSFWKTLKEIRKNHYDAAITPHSSTTTALLLFLAGIKIRVGFNRWTARYFLTHKAPHPARGMHKIDKNMGLLTALDGKSQQAATALYPSEADRQKAAGLLQPLLQDGQPLIALAPGSVWFTKRWPARHYSALSRLLADAGYGLVFIGAPDEQELCAQVIRQSGADALNLAGELSILESAAVIGRCDLIICNDSGALHLANAMQTDVFAFFGPTVQSIGYYPYRKNDRVFELEMDCRPCGSHGANTCPLGHHHCMENITPLSVFDAVQRKFK